MFGASKPLKTSSSGARGAESEDIKNEIAQIRARILEIECEYGIDALALEGAHGATIFTIENSHTFRLLVESLNEGAAIFLNNGVVTYCNARLAAILGAKLTDVIGSSIETWIEEIAVQEFQSHLRSTRLDHSPKSKLSLKKKDGTALPVLLSLRNLQFGGDQATCFIATDLTELKLSEDRLFVSEGRYRQIVETVQEGIVNTNREGLILFVNRVMAPMLGYEVSELVGSRSSILFHEADLPVLNEIVELRKQGYNFRGELRLRAKTGADVWTLAASGPLLDDRGQITGGLGTYTDITERKRIAFQATQVGKLEALGQLAGGIAHDFNNILSVIGMTAEMVIDVLGDGHAMAPALDAIVKAQIRGAGLTRQLLTFSRNQVSEERIVDLNSSLHSLYQMLKRILGGNVELICEFAKRDLILKVDPSQIDNLVMNLVINARDAIEGEGQIIVRTSPFEVSSNLPGRWSDVPVGDYALIEVEDTGCGIPQELLSKIFDPFFTTKSPEKGTGLGLATAYGIVKRYGGAIDVQSRPGQTCFSILLPIVEGDEIPVSLELQKLSKLSGEDTIKILLVEDNAEFRTLCTTSLRKAGFDVTEAADGKAALETYRNSKASFDLLITDIQTPHLTGTELFSLLESENRDLEVLLCPVIPQNPSVEIPSSAPKDF